MIHDAFLSSATAVSGLLHTPALDSAWDRPSALPAFTNGALAGHLARAVFNTQNYLAGDPPTGAPTHDAATYLAMVATLTTEDNERIIARGSTDAGTGAADLCRRYDAAVADLRLALPRIGEDTLVTVLGGRVMAVREYLVTRLVELLVHADDLAVSLGVPTPAFADEAAEPVVMLLARFAHRRHGTPAMLRALSRAERAGPIPAL